MRVRFRHCYSQITLLKEEQAKWNKKLEEIVGKVEKGQVDQEKELQMLEARALSKKFEDSMGQRKEKKL